MTRFYTLKSCSYLGTDLVSALTGLDVNNLPHCQKLCEKFSNKPQKVAAWLSNNLEKPDKGFIFLDCLQNEAGIVVGGALLDAEKPDWCETRFSDGNWSEDRKYWECQQGLCVEKKERKVCWLYPVVLFLLRFFSNIFLNKSPTLCFSYSIDTIAKMCA